MLKSQRKSNRRSAEGEGVEMAEQGTHTGGNEQDAEPLSADDYLKLLKLLKIKLPKGVLISEAVPHSTHTNVIQDARSIKEELEQCQLKMALTPRLACGRIQQALHLKEEETFQDLTKMIFFREVKRSLRETPTKGWGKKLKPGCGFRIRETYHETSHFGRRDSNQDRNFGTHAENQRNATECFNFYLQQEDPVLTEKDVNYERNKKLEFGFLSGKPNFRVDIKRSAGDDSAREKVIVKTNSVTQKSGRTVFTPREEDSRADFITSHQYYLQAQAYLFILKEKEQMEEDPVPVRAVMVMKVKPSGLFYWGEVSEDTAQIQRLNTACQTEALPRFLALLNLIFEKEK